MANSCYFTLCAKGNPENLKEFFDILDESDWENNKHFYRIYSIETKDEETFDEGYFIASGSCAWSVYSCMFEGSQTYYTKDKEKNPNTTGTSILQESERLGLEIEIFSEEYGIGFHEHYIIKEGSLIQDLCVDAYCIGSNENGEDIISGGVENWGSFNLLKGE